MALPPAIRPSRALYSLDACRRLRHGDSVNPVETTTVPKTDAARTETPAKAEAPAKTRKAARACPSP